MSPEKPDALLWMDVETTGLDANKCSILEIGLRCTTLDAMREHALLEAVVHISRETMLSAQLPALDLHLNNGLLAQCETSDPVRCSPEAIARKTVRFIKDMSGIYTLHPRRHEHPTLRPAHNPQILRNRGTHRRPTLLPGTRPDRTAPHSQDARPRPLHAQGQAHAPRPRLPGQGHHGIPALPHPHGPQGDQTMLKPRCILCRKPVPDNHTRCVKHWLNNQNQWMEDDQPVHQHCTPRRRPL